MTQQSTRFICQQLSTMSKIFLCSSLFLYIGRAKLFLDLLHFFLAIDFSCGILVLRLTQSANKGNSMITVFRGKYTYRFDGKHGIIENQETLTKILLTASETKYCNKSNSTIDLLIAKNKELLDSCR